MSQEELKTAVLGVIDAFTKNPEASKMVFRAETKLVETLRCEGKIRDFPTITIDEPPDIGGGDAGPNPVELLLLALGTCQEVMYGAYASVMDIQLDEVTVDVKGYIDFKGLLGMDENVPSGYTKVQYITNIKSSASDEALRKLVDTVESHCPVYDTLTRPIEVTGEVSINGTKK